MLFSNSKVMFRPLTTSFGKVLDRFGDDPCGGSRRGRGQQKDAPTSDRSSSSEDAHLPNGRRRPPRKNEDDLRDKKFDPPEFKGALNMDVSL